MRDIQPSQLQHRLELLNAAMPIDVAALMPVALDAIQQTLPSKELGKRLLPFIGDALLTCMEQVQQHTANAAPSCVATITSDILAYASTMDTPIDTSSKRWSTCTLQIANAIDILLHHCNHLTASENPKDSVPAPKKLKHTLDIAIAQKIQQGSDGTTRVDIAGTNALVIEGTCIQKMFRGKPVTSHEWCPKVIQYYVIPDAPSHFRKIYSIDVNGVIYDCTSQEIADGTAWTHFPDAIGTYGTQNKTLLANVVDTLAFKNNVPKRGYIAVGWKKTIDGAYRYLLEDGRDLHGDTHYVLGTRADIIERGKKRLSVLPVQDVTRDEAEKLLQWCYDASPYGHQMLNNAAQFRAYLHDIAPAYTSFFLYSKTEGNEASRLGKTTIQLASANLSFPTHYKDTPHASFSGTSTSVEGKIAHAESSNCIIDDLNIPPNASEKDIKDITKVLTMIVRATANHQEARSRAKRDLTEADRRMFEVLPVMNGETMPIVLASIERRMISVEIFPSAINLDMYKESWEDEYSALLLRLGHMALRAIELARNEDENSVRYALQQFEKNAEKQLRAECIKMINAPLSQLCDDMPKVYACLLSSIWALGRYAFTDEVGHQWSNTLYPFVLKTLIAQVNRMDGKRSATDRGSLTSLLHIVRDKIASNSTVNKQRMRILARKGNSNNVEAPKVIREDGTMVEAAYFGSKSDVKNGAILAYIDVNIDNDYVFYPTQIFFDALLAEAKEHNGEYFHFKTKQDIQHAMKNEDLLARRGKDKDVVRIRLPGTSNNQHYEVKLASYLDEVLLAPSDVLLAPSTDKIPTSINQAPSKRNEAAIPNTEDMDMIVPD